MPKYLGLISNLEQFCVEMRLVLIDPKKLSM
jgi:hypothetical protein